MQNIKPERNICMDKMNRAKIWKSSEYCNNLKYRDR